MKILRLRFKNINSLVGEHIVDFTTEPLSQSSIFAIVGPTGSGKSTLLDVITLAIYGRVPRLNKVTGTDVQRNGVIVSHHMTEAYAEVRFEIKGQVYQSSWSITQTRTGRWKPDQMEVSCGEAILDSKKTDVLHRNVSLIGLSYAQFTKAILLSQGQFALLLRADKHERAKLLEDITGTQIYRSIGKQTYERLKAHRAKEEEVQRKADEMQLQSPEAIAALEEAIKMLADQHKIKEQSLDALSKKVQQLERKYIITRAIDQKSKDKAELEIHIDALAPRQLALRKHEEVAPYIVDIERMTMAKSRLKELEAELSDTESKLDHNQHLVRETIERAISLTQAETDGTNLIEKLDEFQHEVQRLEHVMQTGIQGGKEARARLDARIKEQHFKITPQLTGLRDPAAVQVLITDRLLVLDAPTLLAVDIHTTRNRLAKLDERLVALRELLSISTRQSSTEEVIKASKDKEAILVQDAEKAFKELQAGQALIEQSEKTLQGLQQEKLAHSAVAALDDRRRDLIEGEPCPLCGATDHPYADPHALHRYVELDEQIARVTLQLDQHRDASMRIANANAAAKASLNDSIEYRRRLEKQHADNQLEIERLCGQDVAWLGLDEEGITNAIQLHRQDYDRSKSILDQRLELDYLQRIEREVEGLADSLKVYSEAKANRDLLYKGDRIDVEVSACKSMYTSAIATVQAMQGMKEKLLEDLHKQREIVHKAQVQITGICNDVGYQSVPELQGAILPAREVEEIKNVTQKYNDRMLTLRTELQSLQEEMSVLTIDDNEKEDLSGVKKLHQQLRQELTVLSQDLGAKTQQLSDQQAKAELKKEITAEYNMLQERGKVWTQLNDMIGDSTGSKYANFAQDLTLRNLIALSNLRLTNLTDRYLIDMPSADSDYLRVVDLYQGNVTRAVTTLSGGETFLLSLAMALSLSDMASRNVQLQSLFIDEGFGTLDQDTLEVAITTLERLQAESNKTIGIISHVAALKERIQTQIILRKSDNGVSTIEVVA